MKVMIWLKIIFQLTKIWTMKKITIELEEAKEGVKSRFDVTFDTVNPASKLSKSMKDWISLSYEEINVEENRLLRTFIKQLMKILYTILC